MSELQQKAYPVLKSVWWTGRDFLDHVKLDHGNISFLYRTSTGQPLPPYVIAGGIVMLALQFLDRNLEFIIYARVMSRIDQGDTAGAQVQCLHEERGRQQAVLDCARGHHVPADQRRSERIPCFFKVTATPEGGLPHITWALNINHHGIFIAYRDTTSDNERFDLSLDFPDQEPGFLVAARVKAIVTETIQPGLGLEFLFESGEQHQAIVRQVKKLTRINEGQGEVQLLDQGFLDELGDALGPATD